MKLESEKSLGMQYSRSGEINARYTIESFNLDEFFKMATRGDFAQMTINIQATCSMKYALYDDEI